VGEENPLRLFLALTEARYCRWGEIPDVKKYKSRRKVFSQKSAEFLLNLRRNILCVQNIYIFLLIN